MPFTVCVGLVMEGWEFDFYFLGLTLYGSGLIWGLSDFGIESYWALSRLMCGALMGHIILDNFVGYFQTCTH